MTPSGSYFETCAFWVYATCAVFVGLLACWPILFTGSVFVFFDTENYLSNGAAISGVVAGLFETGAGEGTGAAAAEQSRGRSIRSMVYSAYVYFGSLTPLGAIGPVALQSVLLAALALLLVPVRALRRPVAALGALAVVLMLSPWAFYASFLMPDLLSAAVILGAMIVIKGTNRRGYWMVGLVVAFAASSHYGNVPLAFALAVCVGFWLLLRRRLSWAATCTLALPLVAAVLVNVFGGLVAFGETSVAPRRLPILLARSLADGPARWHLEAKCDLYDYEICTALPRLPDTVGGALWQKDGLAGIESVEVLDRIRAEERILLWRAFLDYPGAQSWSLMRNAVLQLGRFGLSDVYAGEVAINPDGRYDFTRDRERYRPVLDRLEAVHVVFVLISLAVVLEAMVRRRVQMTPVLAIMFLGFLFNAGIFGGLSAPVDRYQGRIIWILPFMAALILLSRLGADEGD